MKFDVVIGNPPYNRGADLDFLEFGYDISNVAAALIIPAKWQTSPDYQPVSSNRTYRDIRNKLVPHMSTVCFFPCCQDVFDIQLVDGVTYILMDKEIHSTCNVVNKSKYLAPFNGAEQRSILSRESLLNFGNKIIQGLELSKSFNIEQYLKPHCEIGDHEYAVYFNDKSPGGNFATLDAPRKTLGLGNPYLLSKSEAEKFEFSTVTTCVFSSDSKAECESYMSYLNTRLVRFLILVNQSKLSNILQNDQFRFVPDFPDGLNRVYSDGWLFDYYKISQQDREAICSIVKGR